jgi:hypothetical protein
MFRRMMLAMALMASALIGVGAFSSTAGATEENGWHRGTHGTIHCVSDVFSPGTRHLVCDYIPDSGSVVSGALNAWVPWWSNTVFQDYVQGGYGRTSRIAFPGHDASWGVWGIGGSNPTFCRVVPGVPVFGDACSWGGVNWVHGDLLEGVWQINSSWFDAFPYNTHSSNGGSIQNNEFFLDF